MKKLPFVLAIIILFVIVLAIAHFTGLLQTMSHEELEGAFELLGDLGARQPKVVWGAPLQSTTLHRDSPLWLTRFRRILLEIRTHPQVQDRLTRQTIPSRLGG